MSTDVTDSIVIMSSDVTNSINIISSDVTDWRYSHWSESIVYRRRYTRRWAPKMTSVQQGRIFRPLNTGEMGVGDIIFIDNCIENQIEKSKFVK